MRTIWCLVLSCGVATLPLGCSRVTGSKDQAAHDDTDQVTRPPVIPTSPQPNQKTPSSSASGVGNALMGAPIVRVFPEGAFVASVDDGLYNFDAEGAQGAPVRAKVAWNGGFGEVQLLTRPISVIDVDSELMLIQRFQTAHFPSDSFLVRKSDGHAWALGEGVLKADFFGKYEDSFAVRLRRGQKQIFLQRELRSDTEERLVLLTLDPSSDEVVMKVLANAPVQAWSPTGEDSVVLDDVWLTDISTATPIPYRLENYGLNHFDFSFGNTFAFRSAWEPPFAYSLSLHGDRPDQSVAQMLPESVGRFSHGWHIGVARDGLAMLIGMKLESSFIVDKATGAFVSLVDMGEHTTFTNPRVVDTASATWVYADERICAIVGDSGTLVPLCETYVNLGVRGSITSVRAHDGGVIEFISSVVGDVEHVTLGIDAPHRRLLVNGRRQMRTFDPGTVVLVPLGGS